MTRKELASKIAFNFKLNAGKDITVKEVDLILLLFINIVRDSLSKGVSVYLRNFGTFSRKLYNERKGVNPLTLERVVHPKKFRPRFTPAKAFKDFVK